MQPLPITIGPAMANIVAFGWTIVPGYHVPMSLAEDGYCTFITWTDGYVAFELDVLTNNCFGMYSKLVTSVGIQRPFRGAEVPLTLEALLVSSPNGRPSQAVLAIMW